jgi:two-component system CheB/CheR fusion protein
MKARPKKGTDAAQRKEPDKMAFPIVGIGASAGGLESFDEFLTALPDNTGMAFVLVQHLAPDHESQLRELLSKSTSLPVLDAAQGLEVLPNHVYVIPPDTAMTISGGILQIAPRSKSGPHLPIDHFFRSLAADRQKASIGVILSGSGSDGAQGLEEIKAAGGITFAQNDETAKFASMPQSAVQSGCVDFILTPREIAEELARIAEHPYLIPAPGKEQEHDEGLPAAEDGYYKEIMALLYRRSGADFSSYRDTSIKRRIMRRMALNSRHDLADYVRFLKDNTVEMDALYGDILIQVTSFFRDPEVFDALKKKLPDLLRNKEPGSPVRIWVPGCSSGQEAYSLAIILLECLDNQKEWPPIQIFATDLNDNGVLHKAREGLYADSIEAEVSPGRLRRFFTREKGKYRISKSIRDMCTFAGHNVTADPPFSRMDLISCRNLLIYLGLPLQRRVIPAFHYALNPGGLLLLGSAETVGKYTDLFDAVDQEHRLYVKKATPARQYPHFHADAFHPRVPKAPGESSPDVPEDQDWKREADRILIGTYAPAGVLVNGNLDILQFRGQTSPYLEPAPGEPSHNLVRMACEGLFPVLRRAIGECGESKTPVVINNVQLRRDGEIREIGIRVLPVSLPAQKECCFLVLFEEEGSKPAPRNAPVTDLPADENEMARLRQELTSAHEYLQTVIEQKDTINEELRSANEEVLSSNEELQSTNEELETAKEELQSVNEELTTVNEQLQYRNQELGRVNESLQEAYDYAQAIVETVREPLIVLDDKLRVQSANQAFYKTFDITPKETENCLFFDLENRQWDIPELRRMMDDILHKQITLEDFEVTRTSNESKTRTMLLNARRILSLDGPTLVLLAIEDITERKRMENDLKEQTQNLRDADCRKNEFLAILAHELRNPLAPISNSLEALKLDNVDPETREQANDIMGRQIRQLVRLIDDLLDVSRIASGKIEMRIDSVNLAEIVQVAVEAGAPMIDAADQELTIALPPEPIWLKADAARLTQILGNLLNNAAKYSRSRGHIWLTAKREGKEAVIEVRDTGIGIPADMQERIFDMFSQVDTSLERAQGGLGIGLTLVKSLVTLQGGTIVASSPGPDQGATFTVRLPLAPAPREKTKPLPRVGKPASPEKMPPLKVLVVDDNLSAAKTMGWMMESLGHEVQQSHNGHDALAKAKSFAPDVVFMDIGLPGMSGYDVCRTMRQEDLLKNTLIVAQTGWGQEEHRKRSEEAGFDHHLVKPVRMEAVEALLASAIKKGMTEQPA